jgi:hypothetical protein
MADNDSPIAPSSGWIEEYTADYRYRDSWLTLIFPIMVSPIVYLTWSESGPMVAVAVAMVAVIAAVMAYFEHRTYYIRIAGSAITRGSCFHTFTIRLSNIDLIQLDGRGARGSTNLYLRQNGRCLLKAYWYLDGFDDFVGFMRSYAHIHHVAFKTRNRYETWH